MSTKETGGPIVCRISKWCRQGDVQTSVKHHGRMRTALDNVCIALLHMSKCSPYDERKIWIRLNAGSYYWKAAIRAAIKARQS